MFSPLVSVALVISYRDEKSKFCCDIADTVDTKFKVEAGKGPYPEDTWYPWLNEAWVKIPPEKIVPEFA
ncbi:MAG TPA: hypothetical protein VKA75_06095, partial [Reyranella sp.]|nr:hypothetical protein [Reyranella sp.]